MRNSKMFRLFFVAAIITLMAGTQAWADSYVRIVRLSDVDGSVQIDRNTGQGFEKSLMNMPITQGVRLKTGMTGRAEVEFENGSVLRLTGDSEVEFTALSLRSNGQRVSEVQVNDGVVYVDFKHKGGDDFRVDVGNRAIQLNKDVRFRARVENGVAHVAVFKGELEINNDGQLAKVKKNETYNLDLNNAAYEIAKGIDTLPTDDYNQEREQYLREYAGNHGSPYAYGYSDLNRYGTFFNAPGYGLVWQPASMGLGWDPYSSGYWSYYPGQGYIWVSNYAWGWTPYRYGQWVFLGGSGWAWQPGNWNQWNTGVVVTNPPPTWHRPRPPQTTGVVPVTTVPVGNPTPPPTRRMIRTEDIMRHGRPRDGERVGGPYPNGSQAQTGTATKSMVATPSTTGNTAPNAVTPAGTQATPGVVHESPLKMNKQRDLGIEPGSRPGRVAPQPSAPARSVNPAPAPQRSMQPAPAPRPAPMPQRTMQPAPRPQSMRPAPMMRSAPPMRPAPAPRAMPSKRGN